MQIAGVTVTEEEPSQILTWTRERGYSGTRRYRVAWADRVALIDALRGVLGETIGGDTPADELGDAWEISDSITLYCSQATEDRRGRTDQNTVIVATYDEGTYSTEQEIEGITIEGAATVQMVSIPESQWVWGADAPASLAGSTIKENMAIPVGETEIIVRRTVSNSMLTLFSNLACHLNNASFQGFAPGLVLFADGRESQTGTQPRNVTMRFKIHTEDWNKKLAPNGQWYYVKGILDTGTTYPIPYGNLGLLLR